MSAKLTTNWVKVGCWKNKGMWTVANAGAVSSEPLRIPFCCISLCCIKAIQPVSSQRLMIINPVVSEMKNFWDRGYHWVSGMVKVLVTREISTVSAGIANMATP